MQLSSRKCACRRELNSHEVSTSRLRAAAASLPTHQKAAELRTLQSRAADTPKTQRSRLRAAKRSSFSLRSSVAVIRTDEDEPETSSRGCARRRAPCKDRSAGRRRGVPRLLLQWRCGSNTMPCMKLQLFYELSALKPNPSLKLSPNGVPRWPSSAGPTAHFALAVQRATPLVPA